MFELSELLKEEGHQVLFFSMKHGSNLPTEFSRYFVEEIDYDKKHSLRGQIGIFFNTLYSREAEKKLSKLIDDFQPDIAHLHNFNHQLTPSILFGLKKKKVPVVMTVHDYKLACPSYSMFNAGRICELCKGQRFYRCVTARCHKGSFAKSLLAALESYLHHRILKSYSNIKYFICPSRFVMEKMKEMGMAGNFVHLPHFVDREAWAVSAGEKKDYIVYCGRLSAEKGIGTLIEALKGGAVDTRIIGEGPLKKGIEERIKKDKSENIKLLGYLNGKELAEEVGKSRCLVMPSEWYEVFGMSVIEAFASESPVIGSRIGGMPEIIEDGETGFLFEPGNAGELRSKILNLLNNPAKASQMGKNARALVENKYNAELHYERLMRVYNDAIKTQ